MPLNLNNFSSTNPMEVIPLDQNEQENFEFLKNLQGNILKGHGRHHSAHIFLKFGNDPAQSRQWIKEFSKNITSAFQQMTEARLRRQTLAAGKKWKETTFFCMVLSAKGYRALNINENHIPSDSQFRNGMKEADPGLNDPPFVDWDNAYQGDVHAMVTIANQNPPQLEADVQKFKKSIQKTKGAVLEISTEHGKVIKNKDTGSIVEHFGYVDGASQPLFFKDDIDEQRRGQGIDQYDPSTPLSAILAREQSLKSGQEHYGSYFVFRKLEQNVKGFKEREEKLAEVLKLEEEEEERAGALAVGRFEDGTPITLQYNDGMHNPIFNNFNYGNDTAGSKCPIHAHIRKVNPREQTLEERAHRITRRGITYGTRLPDMSDRPEKGVGLLFMCFQTDIGKQFEHMQIIANATKDGLDPLIGQSENKNSQLNQHWPPEWAGEEGKTQSFDFQGFVTLKGGEYFFAPSINFLKNIDQIK